MNIIKKQSPNQNERKDGMKPSMLILHYTGTKTSEEADAIYMTPDMVSPHYMVDIDGTITSYAKESMRSWHAGKSSWNGINDINSASIGIEVVNGGHENNLPDFEAVQIEALIKLIRDIRSRWNIADHNILGHSDIAPGRKVDPGEHFPWAVLSEAGIGLMPRLSHSSGEVDTPIELFSALKQWGYDYIDDFDLMVLEFSRHYLPEDFGKEIDEQKLYAAINSLIEQKDLTSPK